MKFKFLPFAVIFIGNLALANLNCSSDTVLSDTDLNYSFFLDRMTGNCTSDQGRKYTFSINGAGISFRLSSFTDLKIICNTIEDDIPGTYLGGKINLAVMLGLTGAVFKSISNTNSGHYCFVGGVGYEMGFGLSAADLTICEVTDEEEAVHHG